MGNGYIKSLDGVRALAIILVMTFHFDMTHFGWFGVQLFFVLSGFLISGILWREKEKTSTIWNKLKKFWIRRSLRIFPLYYGYLLVLGSIYILFHFPVYYAENIPYLLTYTFNFTRAFEFWKANPLFTHLWSLCVEEQFYLFFPLIIFFGSKAFIRAFILGFILAAPFVRYALSGYYLSKGLPDATVADAVYWNTFSHLDAFFMGALIPVFSLHEKLNHKGKVALLFSLIAIVAGAWDFLTSNSGFSYFSDLGYNHGQIQHDEQVWHYTVLNLMFASFLLWITTASKSRVNLFINRILETKFLVEIGRVSYGMYVFHWAILVYFYAKVVSALPNIPRIVLFIPYVGFVYLFAAVSYAFYEKRFIQLKDKIKIN